MATDVVFVRHTEVALRWRGRCYGQLDVGLSRAGTVAARGLVDRLAGERFDAIIYSGAKRTRAVAEPLAMRLGLTAVCDPRWSERDFGDWEGLSWEAIYQATGSAMDGMIDDPGGFRPGGGETTFDMRDRVLAGFGALPEGRCLVVTHGGPIAAVRGVVAGLAVKDWPVCGFGETFHLPSGESGDVR
jgi:broad specificity phosphatase PhoE